MNRQSEWLQCIADDAHMLSHGCKRGGGRACRPAVGSAIAERNNTLETTHDDIETAKSRLLFNLITLSDSVGWSVVIADSAIIAAQLQHERIDKGAPAVHPQNELRKGRTMSLFENSAIQVLIALERAVLK